MKKVILHLILPVLMLGFISANAQFYSHHTYMAKLKDDIAPVDIMVGEYVLFSIHADEEFIYDSFGQQAWMPDGKFGKVDLDMIERVEADKYFKFDHSLDFFTLYDEHDIVVACKAKGIDYQMLITNAIGGSANDLEQLFLLMNVLSGTAGELHKSMMWKVFNRWDDDSFSEFFSDLQEDIQKEIGKFLFKSSTIWPIEDHASYFNEYYSKTLQLIMKYKDL